MKIDNKLCSLALTVVLAVSCMMWLAMPVLAATDIVPDAVYYDNVCEVFSFPQLLEAYDSKVTTIIIKRSTAINRYEHSEAAINANALLKYANFFDVSADYILGRCDDPQGKKYDYQPEYLKDKLANSKEWREFVEMCFDPNSPISSRLKESLFQLAEENK